MIGRCSKNDTHMRSVHVQRHDTAYRRLFFEVQKCVTCLIFEQNGFDTYVFWGSTCQLSMRRIKKVKCFCCPEFEESDHQNLQRSDRCMRVCVAESSPFV